MPRSTLLLALAVAGLAPASADVVLPHIFTDHMVLQAGMPVPVWGRAAGGEAVTVHFGAQTLETKADASGRWSVALAPLAPSADPRALRIAGQNTVTLSDVLVGEVWLCSGQSNMEMAVGVKTAGAAPEADHDPAVAAEIRTGSWPALRLFRVEKRLKLPDVATSGWEACAGEALARFSAAGFFFGRNLAGELHVPVGLIESCWGGSRIEEWTPAAAYGRLETSLGADAPRTFERNAALVARVYDAMIRSLQPYAIRGVLWYQGESQIIAYNDRRVYADKMRALVEGWRAAWGRPDLPFESVQLAPYRYSARKDRLPHAPDELPQLWEAQLLATAIPHTGLVPIADTVTNPGNIHPGGKPVVGRRLAALALREVYGRRDVVAAGPVFLRASFRGPIARVWFRGASGGLIATDGKPLSGFELAGPEGHFVPAEARIRGESVELRSATVPEPRFVRYDWTETVRPNLANRAGWPAYPFRSDGPSWRPGDPAPQ